MADIASVVVTKELLSAVAFTATAAGGDLITGTSVAYDTELIFKNDHSSAVTVTIDVQTAAAVDVPTYGRVTKPDASVSVPAGDIYIYRIPKAQLAQYLNGASKIALTYASHNVAFKVAALRH